MIYVTGRTFEHRPLIRELGGYWNANAKRWEFDDLTERQLERLNMCVGLSVVKQARQNTTIRDILRQRERFANVRIKIGDDMTYRGEFADDDPMIFAGFSSLGKFADYVETLKQPPNGDGLCDIGWTGDPEHTGTQNLPHALALARGGWLDGLGIGDRLLPPEPMGKRRQRAVAGGRVNVGRMLAGAPDHMVRRTPQPNHKIITIFIECCMWIGIDINTALVRVVAVAAIVDRLEQQGYQCNLIATYCARQRDTHRGMHTVVRIKDAGERLSIADCSFAFGHPSFGRRLVFAHEGSVCEANLERESRGFISQAFTKKHPPPTNSFYIPQVFENITDIWEMIEAITPDGLPIAIRKDDQ